MSKKDNVLSELSKKRSNDRKFELDIEKICKKPKKNINIYIYFNENNDIGRT